jgi:hypothetical protein
MALSANGFKQVNVVNRDTNQRVPITSGAMVSTLSSDYLFFPFVSIIFVWAINVGGMIG